jgi:hypothetical protein
VLVTVFSHLSEWYPQSDRGAATEGVEGTANNSQVLLHREKPWTQWRGFVVRRITFLIIITMSDPIKNVQFGNGFGHQQQQQSNDTSSFGSSFSNATATTSQIRNLSLDRKHQTSYSDIVPPHQRQHLVHSNNQPLVHNNNHFQLHHWHQVE